MSGITISISALLAWLAALIKSSGIVPKVGAWVGSLSLTALFMYAWLFGGAIKRVMSALLTIFLVLVVLAFLSQAGALPTWFPVFTW